MLNVIKEAISYNHQTYLRIVDFRKRFEQRKLYTFFSGGRGGGTVSVTLGKPYIIR